MKKIGIVTFHQALNYGAKLQAYALQQFLEKNGIENDVIDYTCHFMYTRNIRPIRVGKHHKLKSFIRSLITMRQVGIDRKKSVTFRNEFLNLSRPFDAKNIGEASNEYAALALIRYIYLILQSQSKNTPMRQALQLISFLLIRNIHIKSCYHNFSSFQFVKKAEQILLKILSTEKLKSVLIPRCCLLKMIGIK